MIADRHHAVAVSAATDELVGQLSRALDAVRMTGSKEDVGRLARAIAGVVATLEVELLLPLYQQHPDLAPTALNEMGTQTP